MSLTARLMLDGLLDILLNPPLIPDIVPSGWLGSKHQLTGLSKAAKLHSSLIGSQVQSTIMSRATWTMFYQKPSLNLNYWSFVRLVLVLLSRLSVHLLFRGQRTERGIFFFLFQNQNQNPDSPTLPLWYSHLCVQNRIHRERCWFSSGVFGSGCSDPRGSSDWNSF